MVEAFCLACVSLALCLFTAAASAAQNFTAPTPVLITSVGQSPDAFTLRVLAGRIKLNFEYNNLAEPKVLKQYKSVLIAVGASQKGFGAAGINPDTELKRAEGLTTEAKKLGIPIIVAHIGGQDRRDPMSMKLLEMVLPKADYLIVYKVGNEDQYFSKAAKSRNIPIRILDQVLDVTKVLGEVFSK